MRRLMVDGQMCWRLEVEELTGRSEAPSNYRGNAMRLHEIISLMGSAGRPGPLMKACIRAAEHQGRGGHRHMRRRVVTRDTV